MKSVQPEPIVGKASCCEDDTPASTQLKLRSALMQLLLKNGWERTNVAEICKAANVARSTFYLHFSNKEELLHGGFEHLRQHVRQIAGKETLRKSGKLGFVKGVAEHIFENRSMFLALAAGNGGAIIREKFKQLIAQLAQEELRHRGIGDLGHAQFLAGAFITLAQHMMLQKNSSPEKFDQEFHRFLRL